MDGGLSISGQSLHGRPRQAAPSGRANPAPAARRTSGSSSLPPRLSGSTAATSTGFSARPSPAAAAAAARPRARAPTTALTAVTSAAASAAAREADGSAGRQYNNIVLRPGACVPVTRRSPLTTPLPEPKTMTRGKVWSEEVEEAYRFQLAKFRDRTEYVHFHGGEEPDRWPNGMIKMLQLRSGFFYYYNRTRECASKDIHRTKLYAY